jgi:hypothetical protein
MYLPFHGFEVISLLAYTIVFGLLFASHITKWISALDPEPDLEQLILNSFTVLFLFPELMHLSE